MFIYLYIYILSKFLKFQKFFTKSRGKFYIFLDFQIFKFFYEKLKKKLLKKNFLSLHRGYTKNKNTKFNFKFQISNFKFQFQFYLLTWSYTFYENSSFTRSRCCKTLGS